MRADRWCEVSSVVLLSNLDPPTPGRHHGHSQSDLAASVAHSAQHPPGAELEFSEISINLVWSTLIGLGMSRLCSLCLCGKGSVIGRPYAIKTQLKAPEAPYYGFLDEIPLGGYFLPFAVSLWHKGGL